MDIYTFDGGMMDQLEDNPATPPLLFPEALEAYIEANMGITAWASHIPQKVVNLPQVIYEQKVMQPYYTISGATKLVKEVYDLTVVCDDKLQADILADILRKQFQSLGRCNFGGLTLTSCRIGDQETEYEDSPVGTDNGYWTVTAPYIFFYLRQ